MFAGIGIVGLLSTMSEGWTMPQDWENSTVIGINKLPPHATKTLVVWVALDDVAQRGGSALTLDDGHSHFDGIVFGERAPHKWMAGSDRFRRTPEDQSHSADETGDGLVCIAIVYEGQQITVYRDAALYAQYAVDALQTFGPDSLVLFGKRHIDTTDKSRLRGQIEDARIYGRPLSQKEIAGLTPNRLSSIKPVAWWDFEGGRSRCRWCTHT
jgi:hypothetical protein